MRAAVFYMLYSWYATYLKTARDVSETTSGWQTSMVMAGGACGCLCGGFLSDWLVRRTGERRRSRRIIGCGSFVVAGLSILAAIHMREPLHSSLCIALAFFCVQLQIPRGGAWRRKSAAARGRHVRTNELHGRRGRNRLADFSGALSDYLKAAGGRGPHAVDPGFYAYAGLMGLAALCWLAIDPYRSLVSDEEPSGPASGPA